jgi:hypothetical protein
MVVAWWRSQTIEISCTRGWRLSTNYRLFRVNLLLVLASTFLVPSPAVLVIVFYCFRSGSLKAAPGSHPESGWELLYDWWFTANQFFLAPSPLRITFLQLNPCGHGPYVTFPLTRRWVWLLWICFAFVKCTYRTYSIGLHGYGECLFFPGSGQSDESDSSEWRTSHRVWDESLRAELHLYVSLAAVYWAHSSAFKCHLHQTLWLWVAWHRRRLSQQFLPLLRACPLP